MANQNDSEQDQTLNHANQEDGGAADPNATSDEPDRLLIDSGNSQEGDEGNVQSEARGNIGGVPGGQHNDWGHSPVATGGSAQSSGPGGLRRQGVMPGEEMGHLQRGPERRVGKRRS
jgi:hypothetical protein